MFTYTFVVPNEFDEFTVFTSKGRSFTFSGSLGNRNAFLEGERLENCELRFLLSEEELRAPIFVCDGTRNPSQPYLVMEKAVNLRLLVLRDEAGSIEKVRLSETLSDKIKLEASGAKGFQRVPGAFTLESELAAGQTLTLTLLSTEAY